MKMNEMAVGLDLGGTKTLIGLVDEQGNIVTQEQFPTDSQIGPEAHLQRCRQVIQRMMDQYKNRAEICGLGVNVPGLADAKKGRLIYAPFLKWKDVNIVSFFKTYWPSLNIQVQNDVNSCALGELYFGNGQTYDDFLWVTVSTGVGGGLIINRQIVEGHTYIAGEIGHVVVEWDHGRECTCGNAGCLEAHGSGTAIARAAQDYLSQEADNPLASYLNKNQLPITAETIAQAARDDIQPALHLYQTAGKYIGRALSYAVNLLNPSALIIGGGVSRSLNLLLPSMREVIEQSVIHESNKSIPILETGLGYEAGLIGAASLVFHSNAK